jgi:hypothetical protein
VLLSDVSRPDRGKDIVTGSGRHANLEKVGNESSEFWVHRAVRI